MSNVYAAPEADLTIESESGNLATFGDRALASIVDGILMILLTVPLLILFYGSVTDEAAATGTAGILIQYLLPLVITLLFWMSKGATPGKMLKGLRIVDAETLEPASNGRLIIRYIGYYVSSIVLGLGFFWVLWDKNKQGWHDKMAKTLVVKTK